MILRVKKEVIEALGWKALNPFGIAEDRAHWRKHVDVNLAKMSLKKIEALEKLFGGHTKVAGVPTLIKDVGTWKKALKDASTVKPRSPRQFEPLLRQYLLKVSGQRLYQRETDGDGNVVWLAYYVNKVGYEESEKRSRYSTPHAWMTLLYDKFGGKRTNSISFYMDDCRAMTVVEALARKGFYPETPELRADYLENVKRYSEIVPNIGKQYLVSGVAHDDMDGNPEPEKDTWYSRQVHTFQMVREGEPTRAVVDVFFEDPRTDRDEDKNIQPDLWFWSNAEKGRVGEDADEDEEDTSDDEESDEAPAKAKDGDDEADEPVDGDDSKIPVIEVPVHPYVAIFDMKKHLRMQTHVRNLAPYVYDRKLSEKLVLPTKMKKLVELLIERKSGGWRDIVKGKGGGAVVLLAGKSGLGKTLTAEVFAEAEERPLYSVQCSQLGMDPDTLEDELLKVFARARRWNAVTLLDEADVYVHERGNDMGQNAIVGVFLRVLEYQDSVLFLTTNRPHDVDDAILSRCVARLVYPVPTPEEQAKIWRVLSGGAINDKTIATIVEKNHGISGRDVKNLLKLAMLVSDGKPVTPETIDYVKQFQPTALAEKEQR